MDIKQIVKIGLLLYFSGLSFFLSAQDVQIVNALLTNDVSTESICLIDGTDVYNVEVFEERMIMKRLPLEQSGFVEFSVNQFLTSQVTVSLQEENNPLVVYPIEFDDGEVTFNNTAVANFANGDVFRISRCGGEINFYHNGQIVTPPSPLVTGNFDQAFIAVVDVEYANAGADISLSFPNLIPHCVPNNQLPDNKDEFAAVKKQLDGSYYRVTNNVLKFWYKERYAISNNQNNNVQYKVYDWQKNIEAQGSLVNCYGPNWHQIDLAGVPNDNKFYVLEITGPNKGETYFVRFENTCDGSPAAPCNQ